MKNGWRWHHSEETKQKLSLSKLGNKHWLGKKHSEETKLKMRLAHLGKNNPLWKGDDVKYKPLHAWIRFNLSVPEQCSNCGKVTRLDACNVTGVYNRDFNNWQYLCRSCHERFDLEHGFRKKK